MYIRRQKSWERSLPVKLKIKTTFDFGKLAGESKKLMADLKEKTISTESDAMKKRLETGMTIKGKMDGLSAAAVITRILRGQKSTSPPLNASGRLLNSIKPRKSGISGMEYGTYHNKDVVTKNNPVIPGKGKKAKGGLKKRRFMFSGKTIPARKWMHDDSTFRYDKKIIDSFFKSFKKALKK